MIMLIGARQLQKFLQLKGFYKGKIDGMFGGNSKQALTLFMVRYHEQYNIGLSAKWTVNRQIIAATQILFKELGVYGGTVDGLDGPNTQYALEQYQNLMRDTSPSPDEVRQQLTRWPTYQEMESFYGPVGQNIGVYTLPYTMQLAWDTETSVNKISLHKKCAESAIGVLEGVRDHYGSNVVDLRLNLFGGSLNVRKMRGGSQWSVHSWAAALDIDPEHNQFRWNNTRASLDDSEYDKWWSLWEAAGWVSLGKERNFDWMHVQACRL